MISSFIFVIYLFFFFRCCDSNKFDVCNWVFFAVKIEILQWTQYISFFHWLNTDIILMGNCKFIKLIEINICYSELAIVPKERKIIDNVFYLSFTFVWVSTWNCDCWYFIYQNYTNICMVCNICTENCRWNFERIQNEMAREIQVTTNHQYMHTTEAHIFV